MWITVMLRGWLEIVDVFTLLGIDPEELEWQQLALCRSMDTDLFYDEYEQDAIVASTVDQGCASCPVRKQCLMQGIENSEWGVWGGVYLTNGKVDKNRNTHKTQADWQEIGEMISG